MGSIQINGNNYSGNNITISGNKVIIDGVDVTPDSKEISINVIGNLNELKVSSCKLIEIKGNVTNVDTQSGSVDINGDVLGNVKTMSGNVECNNISGNISTLSGNIKYRKL